MNVSNSVRLKRSKRSQSENPGTMTENVNRKIEVQLHPDGVAAPAQIAAQTCREIVDFYFAALATADLSKKPPAPEGTFFRFDFSGPELSATDRRSLHENWILAKVFQELMRGVRASLEEAFFFTELISAGTLTAQSSSTLDEILAPFRKKAADLKFPPLLAEVNTRLERPLEFTDAYQSMQAARNCLEHRAGIVSKSDAGPGGSWSCVFRASNFLSRATEANLTFTRVWKSQLAPKSLFGWKSVFGNSTWVSD
jgi:hypothetical protein